jgi:hypothetical protein
MRKRLYGVIVFFLFATFAIIQAMETYAITFELLGDTHLLHEPVILRLRNNAPWPIRYRSGCLLQDAEVYRRHEGGMGEY